MSQDKEGAKQRAEGIAQLKRISRLSKDRGLAALKRLDPTVFEHLTAALFRRDGYKAEAMGKSGDEGVDVIATRGFTKIVVQCKRYDDSVGQPTVRDLYGTMMHNKGDEAYLVTSGTLTRQAESWAQGKPITLIDGFELINWIAESEQKQSQRRWVWFTLGFIVTLLLGGGVGYGLFFWDDSEPEYRYFLPMIRQDNSQYY